MKGYKKRVQSKRGRKGSRLRVNYKKAMENLMGTLPDNEVLKVGKYEVTCDYVKKNGRILKRPNWREVFEALYEKYPDIVIFIPE